MLLTIIFTVITIVGSYYLYNYLTDKSKNNKLNHDLDLINFHVYQDILFYKPFLRANLSKQDNYWKRIFSNIIYKLNPSNSSSGRSNSSNLSLDEMIEPVELQYFLNYKILKDWFSIDFRNFKSDIFVVKELKEFENEFSEYIDNNSVNDDLSQREDFTNNLMQKYCKTFSSYDKLKFKMCLYESIELIEMVHAVDMKSQIERSLSATTTEGEEEDDDPHED
ncbi:uncharacterized protein ASCRUDRAFT_83360 [Ascoidea rubescens DSM 1968]|uniref:Uncharacterized protein n=1 Tax=Ascoidea rubescens DSM 1968 TaxID=1344418 RepID=A0A1D2VP77_9ASCO|nr:hypothetical protein ASCRUDRAFT_83360 [Ascoidea rubescens DSM 1968]ODV63399.1 hypothetical protein ASCRUDRAFT_83360 [Ascoidea rubescens DSM 1968]